MSDTFRPVAACLVSWRGAFGALFLGALLCYPAALPAFCCLLFLVLCVTAPFVRYYAVLCWRACVVCFCAVVTIQARVFASRIHKCINCCIFVAICASTTSFCAHVYEKIS